MKLIPSVDLEGRAEENIEVTWSQGRVSEAIMKTNDLQYLRSGLRVKCEKDVNPSVRHVLKLCGLVAYIYGISYKGCCISKNGLST